MLYAYRVVLTGIHLLKTGEVEANLSRLAQDFSFPFLKEMMAQKTKEQAPAPELDWEFHDRTLTDLEQRLDLAYQESTLPEERDRRAANQFLVEVRLSNPPSAMGV